MKFISTIASLAACASAYKVLTPTLNSTIAKGSTVNVQFSTVDTDPTTFSVYLVNFQTGHFPPEVLSLAQNVQQSAGSVNVRIPCSVSSDYGYQLNFINGTNTYVIYAQSAPFTLTGDCVDPVAPVSTPQYSNSSISGVDVSVSVVTTVVYQNPTIWFVEPNNVIAAAAICPPAGQSTVTVKEVAAAAAPVTVYSTVTKTVALSCITTVVGGNVASVVVPAAAAGTPAAAVVPAVKVASSATVVASIVAQTTGTGTGIFVSGASVTSSGVVALVGALVVSLML